MIMKSIKVQINGADDMSKPSKFFLFNMTTGKKKLTYGSDPDDAYEILASRVTPEELSLVIKSEYVRVAHQDIQKVVQELG